MQLRSSHPQSISPYWTCYELLLTAIFKPHPEVFARGCHLQDRSLGRAGTQFVDAFLLFSDLLDMCLGVLQALGGRFEAYASITCENDCAQLSIT